MQCVLVDVLVARAGQTSVGAALRPGPRATFAGALMLCGLALTGCGSDAGSIPDNCNVYAWEPGLGDMSSFPTSDVLVSDDTRLTGFRVQFPDEFDLAQYGRLDAAMREGVVDLDGVGVQGEMWLGFSGPFDPDLLPVADGDAHAADGIGIIVLPQHGVPYLVPVETRTSTTFLYVRPLRPLPEATRIGVFATRGLSAAAGGCLEPLAAMQRQLREPDDDRRAAIEGLRDLGTISTWRDLLALHVVPTQSITRESAAIAEHIETLSPEFTETSCTDEVTHRRCTAMLTVEDYRGDDGAVAVDVDHVVPDKTWALPVAIWLPPTSVAGPYPTVVWGHGMGSNRGEADTFATEFAAAGWATVAIDAPIHGGHPSVGGEPLTFTQATLRFFAFDPGSPTLFDVPRGRDHWRQATYDKLQLTRALATDGDLDGDTASDVDSSRLVYIGFSLGGIMSTELVAMSDRFSAVVNLHGGGALTSNLAEGGSQIGGLVRLLLPRLSDEQLRQASSVLQMVQDRGDSIAYGEYVLSSRIRAASTAPDYLFGVSIDDPTVPNANSYLLARSLGVPLVGTLLQPVVGLPVSEAPLPLSGNWESGATVGLLQFDVVDASGTPAPHGIHYTELGRELITSFLSSHFEDGTATLTDPYVQLGVPHGSAGRRSSVVRLERND